MAKKRVREYLDYFELRDEVIEQLGYNIDDVQGRFGENPNDKVPYQSFWLWLVSQTEISNGGEVWLPDIEEDTPEWVVPILEKFYELTIDQPGVPIEVNW
jgi:hypothetical protein